MGGQGNPLLQNQKEIIALDSTYVMVLEHKRGAGYLRSICAIAAMAPTIFLPGYCLPKIGVPLLRKEHTHATEQDVTHSEDHENVYIDARI